jgi:hypothetical protein
VALEVGDGVALPPHLGEVGQRFPTVAHECAAADALGAPQLGVERFGVALASDDVNGRGLRRRASARARRRRSLVGSSRCSRGESLLLDVGLEQRAEGARWSGPPCLSSGCGLDAVGATLALRCDPDLEVVWRDAEA